jgi:hypothetical protein
MVVRLAFLADDLDGRRRARVTSHDIRRTAEAAA